jgi:NitT/TauT family transport system substrate-binding protein
MNKRQLLQSFLAASPIKFQLDWRFEGPAALFLLPVAKGYFKDAKLDVTVDAGTGSGGAVSAWPAAPTTWASPTWPR